MLAALCLLLQVAPTVQGAFDEDNLSADTAQALQSMGEAFFGGTELTLVAMFVAVGLLILRARVLGLWLGWVSLAIALLLAIIPIGWVGVVWASALDDRDKRAPLSARASRSGCGSARVATITRAMSEKWAVFG